MPVNFIFPLDASSLSETDFEVLMTLKYKYLYLCFWPQRRKWRKSNCTLLGEFGAAVSIRPLKLELDLFTTDVLSEESACSEIINLNGTTTTNVIPLMMGQVYSLHKELMAI